MNRNQLIALLAVGALVLLVVGPTVLPAPPAVAAKSPASSSVAARAAAPANAAVARGKYLVTIMGCNDCHTPWTMTERGPEPDMSRMLSGHPQELVVTSAPRLEKGPWVAAIYETNTAWAGPWGVSFTANLTPDPETGLGKWKPETFIAALRTGRHEGQGRPILPPMPYTMIRQATDEDLRAIFDYLRSIPPIRNRVPQPIDPPELP